MKKYKNIADRNLIFAEYFNSEQEVRKNGGVPIGVEFSQGKGVLDGTGGIVGYVQQISAINSLRGKIKIEIGGTGMVLPSQSGNNYFLFFENDRFYCNQSGFGGGVTNFVWVNDGELHDFIITFSGTQLKFYIDSELFTTISFISVLMDWWAIGTDTSGNNIEATYTLLEIYNKALTQEEVTNLYNNRRTKKLNLYTDGRKPILSVNARKGVVRNEFSGNLLSDLARSLIVHVGSPIIVDNNTIIIRDNIITYLARDSDYWTIGKVYRVSCTVSEYGGSGGGILLPYSSTAYIVKANGTFVYEYTATATVMYVGGFANSSATIIINSIKEIIPEVTLTDTEVKKEGEVMVPSLNGLTSAINAGSYDDLTGDITVNIWAKCNGLSGAADDILSNGKLLIVPATGTNINRITVSSNRILYPKSDAVFSFRQWHFISVTRTASGVVNIYIDGSLSGPTDQDSGTPVSGTENITIAYGGIGRHFDGKLEVTVLKGILTPTEISQLHSESKHRFLK